MTFNRNTAASIPWSIRSASVTSNQSSRSSGS
eukprot:CAMPEP_0115333586 /NCGR_PEP_ID=MMETSP0270-20121206/87454_1 /TAXON_ID=71861 /ORGANISM="Scrippsiella trochoidea, Strain CCMP3099" /LENGTH=31 /DNA_ID= /DNA_START= /DNA_END= /DNA_ORIENTATION=